MMNPTPFLRCAPTHRPYFTPRASHAGACLLILAALCASCTNNNVTGPNGFTLSGRVRLESAQRTEAGDSVDVLVVNNADSVRIYLYQGSTLKDSTWTQSGAYQFSGLSGGSWSA